MAIKTALKYRLDLLNDLDAIDDSRRGVLIAKNNLLPFFDFAGSVTMDTDPDRKNSISYNTERTTWRAMLDGLSSMVRRSAMTWWSSREALHTRLFDVSSGSTTIGV